MPPFILIMQAVTILLLILILRIAIVIVILWMDHRIIKSRDFRVLIHLSILLSHIFLHNLFSRVFIKHGQTYRACHPIMKKSKRRHRSMVIIQDALIHKDRIQEGELLLVLHRNDQPQTHRRSKAVCSTFL